MPWPAQRLARDPAGDLGLLRQLKGLRAPEAQGDAAAGQAHSVPAEDARQFSPANGVGPERLSGTPGRIVRRQQVTPQLSVFRVERPSAFSFAPGQHVRMGVGRDMHSYSIASAPADPLLEFCVELVPGGRVTPKLWRLRPGDAVALGDKAKGQFLLDASVRRHLFFATVTGVAPFVSMLRHYLNAEQPAHEFYLVHGASYAEELVYRSELEQLARLHSSRFTYVPSVSRPYDPRNAAFSGERGRITAIAAHHAERFQLALAPACIYACGHPAMVAAIHAQFETPDVPVRSEPFFKA